MEDIYYIIQSMRFIKYWLPIIIWMGVIFLFSNRPSITTVDFFLGDFLLKKSAHLIEYAILGILMFRALLDIKIERKKALIISIIFASIYGMTDEFHQLFIAGRTSTIRDVIIDTIGATIGVSICKEKF